MSTTVELDKRSLRQLQANLAALPRNVGRRQLLIALNAAGSPAKAVAQSTAARETGLLSRSMVIKVSRDKQTKWPTSVLVGPSRKVQKPFFGRKTIGPKKAEKLSAQGFKVRMRKPSRYAHLAERKHPAIHNAARALETAGVARMTAKIEQGIAAEAAKLPNR